MITDEKKEEIREAADLVEVVGDYVRLKRSGSGFTGLCPFHDEKTPSFHVTPRLGIYKCFGCGVSGDVFNFLMEMEGVGFMEAMRTLAEKYGVSLPEESELSSGDEQSQREREGIYHALRYAGLFYYRQLKESDEAAGAREYLEKRGYDGAVIRKFGLGYAPKGGEVLLKEAEKEGIEVDYLHKADLVKPSKRGDGFYDTFRERIIFPIFNPSGKVIAFAGRVLGKDKSAKYINSAQTPVYNKSEVVYGINFARNEIRKEEEAILVEGYTDVITMHQCGVNNVVATSGTALTSLQIKVLKRYGKRLVMIYDSDTAGQAAMKRGINIALAGGMDVELLKLPDDEDPDSFMKKFGKDSFLELKKKNASDFVTFLIEQAEAEGDMDRPGDQTAVIESVLESIAEIPDKLARQVYVQHLHRETQKYRGSSDRELFEQLGKILNSRKKTSGNRAEVYPGPFRPGGNPLGTQPDSRKQKASTEPAVSQQKKRPHYEMELIRLMLLFGKEMVEYIGHHCNDNLFEDVQLREFYLDIIKRYQDNKDVSVDHYAHREDAYPKLVADIILEKEKPSERNRNKSTYSSYDEKRKIVLRAKTALKQMKLEYLNNLIDELGQKHRALSDGDVRKKIVREQNKATHERTRIIRFRADDLFPDPDSGDTESSNESKFEYKMKNDPE